MFKFSNPPLLYSRSEVLNKPCPVPQKPGVYGWYFKEIPGQVPTEGCKTIDGLTLLYVGISPSRKNSKQNLRKRIKYHYQGNAYGSTLRLTLGTLLAEQSGFPLRRVGSDRMTFTHLGEQWLDEWMEENAFVCWEEHPEPWNEETEIFETVSLPLNIQDNKHHLFADVLSELRKKAKKQAREMPVANEENQKRRKVTTKTQGYVATNKEGEMEYKMSPEEYFRKIIELYRHSRDPKFYNPNIKRGRSSSISSELEDLTALFIALNNPNQCRYFTDQPMKFEGNTTKYPDIVIQNSDGKIENLIDVKTDIGWNRDGLFSFCEEWENRMDSIKGTETSFKQGTNKSIIHGNFSTEIKYHVVIISKENSGTKIETDYVRVKDNFNNVSLYILSEGLHPNNYDLPPSEMMEKIKIHHDEFERLFSDIN